MAQLIRQSLQADREREDRQRALQRDYDQQKRMLDQLKAGCQVPPGRDPPSYQEATSRDQTGAGGHSTASSAASEASEATAPVQPPPPPPPPEQPELENRLKEVRTVSVVPIGGVYVCVCTLKLSQSSRTSAGYSSCPVGLGEGFSTVFAETSSGGYWSWHAGLIVNCA